MLVIILTIIDQVIKYFIVKHQPFQKIIPGILELTYSENTGTVFGIASGNNMLFALISIGIIAVMTIVIHTISQKYEMQRPLWECVMAGGIGNVIDRIARGFVVDYLYIKPFGVCNFADILIVCGIIGIGIAQLVSTLKKSA